MKETPLKLYKVRKVNKNYQRILRSGMFIIKELNRKQTIKYFLDFFKFHASKSPKAGVNDVGGCIADDGRVCNELCSPKSCREESVDYFYSYYKKLYNKEYGMEEMLNLVGEDK